MSNMTLREMVELFKAFEAKATTLPGFTSNATATYGVEVVRTALSNAEHGGEKPAGLAKILKHYLEEARTKPATALGHFNVAVALYQRHKDVSKAIKRARPCYEQLAKQTRRGQQIDYTLAAAA